jgi:DNA-binding response OmpR family regulator
VKPAGGEAVNASKTILIVDDDAFIRRPLEFILQAEGYRAVTARIRKIGEERPDLILLDVMMPGRDGFSVCTAIKNDARHAHIPVILLSARGQDQDRDRGLAAGALGFMTKPYSPSDLVRRVREILSEDGQGRRDGHRPS